MTQLTHGGRFTYDDNHRRPGYVQLPEDREYEVEEWQNLKLCKLEIELMSIENRDFCPPGIRLMLDQAAYNREKSGYELIVAFMNCFRIGVFPPPWILKGMYERFDKWERANLKGDFEKLEEKTLETFFNTGTKTDWKERTYAGVYFALEKDYWRLKYYFGLTNPRIWDFLARKIESTGIEGDDTIKHTKKVFSEQTIDKLYKESKWSKSYKEHKGYMDKEKPCLSTDEVKEFLQTFPEDVQKEIKRYQKRLPTEDYTTK